MCLPVAIANTQCAAFNSHTYADDMLAEHLYSAKGANSHTIMPSLAHVLSFQTIRFPELSYFFMVNESFLLRNSHSSEQKELVKEIKCYDKLIST